VAQQLSDHLQTFLVERVVAVETMTLGLALSQSLRLLVELRELVAQTAALLDMLELAHQVDVMALETGISTVATAGQLMSQMLRELEAAVELVAVVRERAVEMEQPLDQTHLQTLELVEAVAVETQATLLTAVTVALAGCTFFISNNPR
jgi:hypothetical protein